MSRRTRHIAIFLLGALVFSSYALAATTGTAVIAGTEQVTAGIWDFGTVTVTVNNYSESVPYGQYSTPDSLASAIAAKFSSDCNGPANARSAPGGVINFRMRHSAALTQLNVSISSNLSFSGTPNSLLTIPTTTTATIGATVVAPGQSTAVDVQVSCDSACGMVDYQIDHTEWATVALDGSGHFTANTPSSLAAGLHNVVVKFQGGGMYIASTSNPLSFTVSSGTGGSSSIYSYNISSYTPNGNVSAYTDTVNGGWSNIGYDGLNRLTTATYSPGVGSTQYMCWGYDSFGNRTYQTISTTPCSGSAPSAPLQYDAGNHLSGIAYDASGNVTNDGTNQYLYDAEGRVCAMQSSTSGARVQYIYDAEGQRVAKGSITSWSCDTTSNGFTETSGYVLGPNGEQVTEVDGQGNWVHTNVYAAGQLIATYQNDQQGVHFHLSDWLGTLHVQTDYAGNRESTYQNLPFGELIPPNQSLGATEHFFTGKERDTGSGNDYMFARYYNSATGRFLSPDWSAKVAPVPYAKLDNPQSLNLYSYVLNNPVSRFDADGHESAWDLAKKWLNTVEVKVGASAGVGSSGQWGVAKYEGHATYIGVEAKTGLAGAGMDSKVMTGVGGSASVGPAKAAISAGGEISAKDGASASAGASASLGPAHASTSASVDSSGGHTGASATLNGPDQHEDSKVAASLTIGITVGVGVNLTRVGTAWNSTVQDLNAVGAYLNYLIPSSPMQGSPGLPTPNQ